MPIKIDIPGGGTDTSDATAGANDILSGKTAYVNDKKITGTILSKSAQTWTPGTTNKTISSGYYLSGTQTIKGDSNLKPSNIKSGVSIFGVNGSLSPLEIKNGVLVNNYLSNGGTIQAGSFIQKVQNYVRVPEVLDTDIAGPTYYNHKLMIVKLSDTRVLSVIPDNGYNKRVSLLEIGLSSGIRVITTKSIPYNGSMTDYDMTVLSSTKVLIATTMDYPIYGIIITINGDDISIGSRYQLNSSDHYNTMGVSVRTIDSTHALLTYDINGDNGLCAAVLTVSGSNITIGTYYTLISDGYPYPYIYRISSTRFLVAVESESNKYFFLCSVNGTTVTKSSSLIYSDLYYFQGSDAVFMDDSTFVTFEYNTNDACYSYQILTLTDSSINISTSTTLSGTTNKVSQYFMVFKNTENPNMVTLFGFNYNGGTVVRLLYSGNSFTVSEITNSGGTSNIVTEEHHTRSCYSIDDNQVFAYYTDSSSNHLCYARAIFRPIVQLSINRIDGVTVDPITKTTGGNIYILN